MSETPNQTNKKKSWLCVFPGCKESVKTHYNCYSHVWDGHLRHLSNSPLFSEDKNQVYKKIKNKSEIKKLCEVYMVEIDPSLDIQQQCIHARNKFSNKQTNTTINSFNFDSNSLEQTLNNNQQEVQIWQCITQNCPENQLKDVLQHDDFIRIVQINENLKRLYIAGEVLAENGFLQRSDARVKEHIEPLKGCVDKILNLTGKSFKYIGKDEKKLGFIAQEVQEVCPELVHEDEFGLSVDVIGIIPILVEALKEIHKAASETKNNNSSKLESLSKATNDALEIAKKFENELKTTQLSHDNLFQEFPTYNFSMGPAVITLFAASILSLISGYIVYSLPKLPGMWVYCWTITIVMWTSCWRQRNELSESIQTKQLVLYWHRENSLSTYIFMFLGVLALGMSVIMGNSIITLSIVCVGLFFILGIAGMLLNKKFKISFSIIFTTLILFFICVCIIIGILFIIQPDYACSFNDYGNSYLLSVTLNETIPKQVISELPWNCWSSSFEFSSQLPPGFYGVSNSDTSSPYIEGTPIKNFPTTTINVYITCVNFVKFYCASITFQTCSNRTSEIDCKQNNCQWNSSLLYCH
ncbi:hypothetical protein CL6EHI_149030 [Entamoeba histolytica]|uniref:Peptidase S74 domain-containing protein n=5 Tax=Entamoeba histolytica TaxID=5759 RepID=C4LT69_ENTH1|nr:hypothetical protein EHI_149030 [Entamoeba histolytica HM-1:IMSS]EAL46847.1 hypothetical protein EHI_149030 [Entamoeba histolytica HM-1:IMSS]EMD46063.1 Hypothetical protein EHI5A_186590 [Entamoeba histolytica KU27]ENY62525.1 hypothetical protein EHI7A_141130 [Entamoeba histolytica HM-1:IMSS-A]GAT91743.1 hypothetical protein CL6EHI_149030 [Entamoeba histolytica]|eukprot:XP_652233.1 hypothetical protein EHI_149030 [Entamoeba histolytica HM-1:IMSS]